MPQRKWDIERVTLKVPYLLEIELKNRTVKDVPVHIFSKLSGKCLDVEGASQENAAKIIQYWIHGGDNQKWRLLIAEPL